MKSWPTKKLGKICDFVFGFSFRASEFNAEGKGLPVIRIGDIDKGVTAKFFDGKCNPRYLVKKNNLLIGLSGTIKIAKWQGNVALLNQRVVKLTNFSESIYPDFVYYQMPRILRGLEEKVSKLTVKNVLLPHLQNLEILAPPLKIQKRIVGRIEELFGKIDKAKELRQKAQEETTAIFPSALQEVFGKAEKKWGTKKLGEICRINPSKAELRTVPDNLEVSFISMPAVDDISGSIITQEVKLLSRVKKGYTYFKESDVLFAKITPCMENGKSAIAKNLYNGIGFGSTEFHVLRPLEKVLPEWIYFYIRQPWFREEAKRHFTGTAGQQRVPKEFLERSEIPLPSLPEQKRIVAYLDGLREKVEKLQKLQKETQKEIDELKQSILDKAFKGEL